MRIVTCNMIVRPVYFILLYFSAYKTSYHGKSTIPEDIFMCKYGYSTLILVYL